MTRAARFAGIAIAAVAPLVLATCRDGEPTGFGRIARASVNLASLASAATPGQPNVPLDSIRVALTRVGDLAPALDTVLRARGDTIAGDSLQAGRAGAHGRVCRPGRQGRTGERRSP